MYSEAYANAHFVPIGTKIHKRLLRLPQATRQAANPRYDKLIYASFKEFLYVFTAEILVYQNLLSQS